MLDYAMLNLLAYDEALHKNCIVLSRPFLVSRGLMTFAEFRHTGNHLVTTAVGRCISAGILAETSCGFITIEARKNNTTHPRI